MKHIPNFITSLNLAAGFIAIVFTVTGELATASWLILAAMIFDFLDGLAARLLNSYSDIGKELDSLADIVSFGVAPALIIYQLISNSLTGSVPLFSNAPEFKNSIIRLIPVIMPVCAGLRLAIFNTDESQTISFRGLPTPANALAVISLVIADHYTDAAIYDRLSGSPSALIIITIILSLLMVSRVPLLSLKFTDMKFRGNEGRYILITMVLVSLLFLGLGAAPLIIPFYIFASLLSLIF